MSQTVAPRVLSDWAVWFLLYTLMAFSLWVLNLGVKLAGGSGAG